MVKCLICMCDFKRVTRTHLLKHGLSTDEYLQQYPGAELVGEELRRAYSKAFRENNPMHNPEYVNKVVAALTGTPKTACHRQKISEFRKGRSWGTHTEEHKEKMRQISKDTMEVRKQNGWKAPKLSEEQRAKISHALKGNTNAKGIPSSTKGKKLNLTPEQRLNRSEKRRAYMNANPTGIRTSSFETKFMEFCNSHAIVYIHQFPIENWTFDFFLPSIGLLVELDGEYWHTTRKTLNRDKIKSKVAEANQLMLLRISDHNPDFMLIFNDMESIKDHTATVLNERQQRLSGTSIPEIVPVTPFKED